jgi:hypothetical protein
MTANAIAVLSCCAVLVAVQPARTAEVASSEGTLQQFHEAVEAYAQLHRRLEQDVPPLKAGSTPYAIVASSDALAAAVKAARSGAREGDIFSREEGDAIRVLIARALYTHHYSVEDLLAAGSEESPVDAPRLAVNARFPWAHGAAMWPCVLLALPPLPEELQYRIVGQDLVLVDVHANLVVDILRHAVRPTS